VAPALISLDTTPKTPADQQKLARALQVLGAEDAELRVSPGVGRNCTVIGATSEAHLEEIVDRLKRAFEVEATVGRPTVAYLETLTRSAEGSAKHVRIAMSPSSRKL
jgi:elongation factor G